jgi:NADPH-dependent 2,4-dienoyl-CoA reductase/sulfur reductase-like enzyme/peroxiredoxin family protein/rhodanese-related sulfurtransferase/TusA-related sulfurtransferase
MGRKVIIVGGVAGGASAAARLRRLDEEAEIIMFERGEYISFANCGLPYYIGESIKERGKLLVQTPEAMKKRFNIDIRINSSVISVDTQNKVVKIESKDKGTYEENYDSLILSPGARPMKPPIPGIESKGVFTLRNIPDTDSIKAYVDSSKIKDAVVIGGGYIGVEMAENLKDRGLNVTLVEAAPHILAPFDSDMVTFAEKELSDNGINLILKDGVSEFKEESGKLITILKSGISIESDMVVLSIGVVPDTNFLKGSGIELGPKGHIIVNENMETNIKGIFAAGDAVEVMDFINGSKTAIALAGPANKQGRIAADNVCGISSAYKGTQGTAVIKVFGLTGASTGNNERTLKAKNIEYRVIYVHPASHASYYPGSTPISIKLIFDNSGIVLGAQAFGYDGVDKRIDDIAAVIRLKGTVHDLAELELAYAPPYSSAKDPVNMAGFVAENVLSGRSDVIVPDNIENIDFNTTTLVDLRSPLEVANGAIDGHINIPVDELRSRLNELDKEKEIWVYCQVGLRGYIGERILKQNGFKVKNLTGGYKTYSMSRFKPKAAESRKEVRREVAADKYDKTLDACGLCCPGPLMQVKATMDGLKEGETLKVTASDPGFYEDINSWCMRTNNDLLERKMDKGIITALIMKGTKLKKAEQNLVNNKDNKTIVVFDGDLDKAIAAFIIANGAASMGKKVTMFFTFWGLNILRREEKVNVKKGFMDRMFGAMMPRGSKKLKLSNMNMMGMGAKMIRKVMKDKNVTSLEDLIKSAVDSGIQIVACQMSMDVMGIRKEELIDGVKIGGVGYYLGEAEDANVNLFV